MQIAIPIGAQPVTASGVQVWALDLDEATILTGYRLIRDQPSGGSMACEFRDGQCTRLDVRPNVGNTALLNDLIRRSRKLLD